MKPYFVAPAAEVVRYRGRNVMNHPVNLSLCQSLQKARYAHYPDNVGIPSIKFIGCDVEWVYSEEEQRHADFERLISREEEF